MQPIVLTPSQISILGLAAMFLTWIIGLVVEKFIPWLVKVVLKKAIAIDLDRWFKTFIVAALAFAFAFWWFPASLPATPPLTGDFISSVGLVLVWIQALLVSLSPVVGAATLIYNWLLSYILDPAKQPDALKNFLAALLAFFIKPPTVPPVAPPTTP